MISGANSKTHATISAQSSNALSNWKMAEGNSGISLTGISTSFTSNDVAKKTNECMNFLQKIWNAIDKIAKNRQSVQLVASRIGPKAWLERAAYKRGETTSCDSVNVGAIWTMCANADRDKPPDFSSVRHREKSRPDRWSALPRVSRTAKPPQRQTTQAAARADETAVEDRPAVGHAP